MKASIFSSKTKVILTLAAVSLLMAGCYRHYPAYGHGYGKGKAYAGGYQHGPRRGGKHGGYGSYGFYGKY